MHFYFCGVQAAREWTVWRAVGGNSDDIKGNKKAGERMGRAVGKRGEGGERGMGKG